ncbi:beta-glucosidase BoGH3B-like isoform X4 [Panicum virgatum]|nr:beta-glucosidase BoGH3B-like isoform X4 [Panicum virgatum]XP_039782569.1 beta-glucosidase BoGH3B-like isoform X4 [Panicum virgatum]XP_039782570.1 beta-glucosidase BoGH3B-like isoform X4 [Panicum virgatum]
MALLTAPAVAALLLLFWSAAYGGAQLPYKDPSLPVEARVKDLLGRMTLAEKIGQMTQIERKVASPQVLKDNFIGSLLSGGGSVPRLQATAADWMSMISDYQKACLSTRLGIPMIYGIDAVHGHNNVYGATIFPHNVALGATRDPDLVKRIGAATALEVRATGIQYAFAPCIAVCRDPRWGRCYESYSEDHKIVQAMTELIPGLQGDVPQNFTSGMPYVAGQNKVAACAKHFVGDGGTHDGINENNTIIDRPGLMSIHMPAYLDSLRKGVSTVMISYSSWNGIKMHANHNLITNFLKGRLNFKVNKNCNFKESIGLDYVVLRFYFFRSLQGFTISDWEGIDRITSPAGANYSYSVQAGILAGIDMIMVPNNYQSFISILTGHVNSGVIPMSRIDDAVTRILRVKFTMGLFENPMPDATLADQLGKKEHRDLAREAVRKSLVLLKNGKPGDAPLLPLPKKAAKILVAGSHADNLGYQCGGWTIEWQGDTGRITVGTTILDSVKAAVDPSTAVVFAENPDADFVKNGGFSYAIVAVGEHPYTETQGDSMNLTIPDPGPSTIQTVCGAVRCATLLVTGRPVVIQPFLGATDALVAAWLPGSEGQGVTDVLFGDYGFTGKLPRTWFKSVDQLPMNVGDAHYDPLFPLGFGLTTNGNAY